jgi:hypothetical protein
MRIKKNRVNKLGTIGKIKVGELSEKGYPTSLDHFRATSNQQRYVDIFNEIYGEANQIPICFCCDDDSFNTNHRFEIWNHQGKLYCYGDGEEFFVSMKDGFKIVPNEVINEKYGGSEAFMTKTQEYLSTDKRQAKWSEVLTLRFIIAKIPIFGVWELRTMAAKSSIDQILNSYDMIKEMNGGSVAQIPFFLNVKKVKSARVMEQARVYPVISLDPLLSNQAKENIFNLKLMEQANTNLLIEGENKTT